MIHISSFKSFLFIHFSLSFSFSLVLFLSFSSLNYNFTTSLRVRDPCCGRKDFSTRKSIYTARISRVSIIISRFYKGDDSYFGLFSNEQCYPDCYDFNKTTKRIKGRTFQNTSGVRFILLCCPACHIYITV